MAIVKFSVPEDVKAAFDEAFAGRNKSAVIAALMRRAVADQALQKRRERLLQLLTARRPSRGLASDAKIRMANRGARS